MQAAAGGIPKDTRKRHHNIFFATRAIGYWRQAAVVSWMVSFRLSMRKILYPCMHFFFSWIKE